MAWWHRKPKVTKDFEELTQTYNEKYGNYDYASDSRSLDATFKETLLDAVGNLSDLNVLIAGSNSGYEIRILNEQFPTAKFTAVDISTDALSKLGSEFPGVSYAHANMEKLPFKDKEFDIYINCRAIHSTDVDIPIAVIEAIRVTKGKIVLTVSNGYRVEDSIVKGMYDYDAEKIDENKPAQIIDKLKVLFEKQNYNLKELSSGAELFIVATPNPDTK